MKLKAHDLCMKQYDLIMDEIAVKIVTCDNNNNNLAREDFIHNIALLEGKANFFWRIGMKMLPAEGIPVKLDDSEATAEAEPTEVPQEKVEKPKRTTRSRKVASKNAE